MSCPDCGCNTSRVVYNNELNTIEVCDDCGYSFGYV